MKNLIVESQKMKKYPLISFAWEGRCLESENNMIGIPLISESLVPQTKYPKDRSSSCPSNCLG